MEAKDKIIIKLSKRIVDILDVKANKGCKQQKWEGFQNSEGEDVWKDIDELIFTAKQMLEIYNTDGL